ncbi:MAG: HAD hydrolase-like protein [Anaerolineae bacterium]|nr:HAD hydrolase-like protein [Anaerolineae bacterium]
MFDLIAFDADDTLWHNEPLYAKAQDKLADLLASYADSDTVIQRLYETEVKNLGYYGYGIKSFTLSMIETAIKLTNGRIPGVEIEKIIGFAQDMLAHHTQLLEHVEETIGVLAQSYPLMIITKGDLLDQEVKLSRSRIGNYFQHIEIVSNKTEAIYANLLTRHKIEPQRFLMVGNSLKSDILPVIALGGHAVYIPYHVTWAHEIIEPQPGEHNGYYELEHIGQLAGLIEELGRG